MPTLKHTRLLITFLTAVFIIAGTILVAQFAKGYRFGQGTLSGTGLLAANSFPDGARIYLDGNQLETATDETINLDPGTYQVEIKKDGYTSWQKTVSVQAEVVTQTNAHLFRTVPSLTPLSFSGATNITPSPDGQKIAFAVASSSATLKDGLYLLELSDNPFAFSRNARQIAQNPFRHEFETANLLWSPDSSQILASFDTVNYLLETNRLTKSEEFSNTTRSLPLILSAWEQEIEQRERQLLLSLPEEMLLVATSSAKNLYFSPDGQKLLYTAAKFAVIPENLERPLPGSNTQPEARTIETGNTYIYDIKEDKNFLLFLEPAELPANPFSRLNLVTDFTAAPIFRITPASPSGQTRLQDPDSVATTIDNFLAQYSSYSFTDYQWFPTSNHILISRNGSLDIVEYDGTNLVTLYAGSFIDNFVYPWPDGSKLVILTNLTNNPDLPPNLYSINLK